MILNSLTSISICFKHYKRTKVSVFELTQEYKMSNISYDMFKNCIFKFAFKRLQE